MPDPSFVWSLAESHCVWCGKPEAGEAEWQRSHDDGAHDDDDCWCMAFCWESCDLVFAEDRMLGLRGLAEAQAAVIARFRDGWVENHTRSDPNGTWWHRPRDLVEPMSEAERQVLYGPVTEGDDSDA